MAIQRCPWCGQANPDVEANPFCSGCGHRADLARADCDCAWCRLSREQYFMWLDDVVELTPPQKAGGDSAESREASTWTSRS
jgi:hypothetical protein